MRERWRRMAGAMSVKRHKVIFGFFLLYSITASVTANRSSFESERWLMAKGASRDGEVVVREGQITSVGRPARTRLVRFSSTHAAAGVDRYPRPHRDALWEEWPGCRGRGNLTGIDAVRRGKCLLDADDGFTTAQSLGSPLDPDLRDAIARGVLPGPRLLTSIVPVDDRTGTPEQIKEFVRKVVADGADLVKIFASKSIREGGDQSFTMIR